MKIRNRKITSLVLAGSILAGGGLGVTASSALAHDGTSKGNGVARAERGGPHGAKAAVMTAVTSLLGVDNAALKTARQSGTSLSALAQQKGVARADLVSTIAAALKANRPAGAPALSDAQATARAGKMADHVPGQRANGPRAGRAAVGAAIAKAIGVTTDELKAARKAGTSPAALAQQKGVARDTVVAAVVAALKAGKPAGAPARTDAQLTQMAERIVDGTGPGHGPRGRGGARR